MPRKPAFDRNDMIDRARDLFWQRGWAGTSLKDIEAALDMRPGSFYAAFGSKDAMFELALDKYAADGTARLTALADNVGPLSALRQYPQIVIQSTTAAAKACMLAKTVLELQAHHHPLAVQANNHLLRMGQLFERLFADAIATGEISAAHDPLQLARRYQSDLLGLRLSAERSGVDATAIANEIAVALGQL